MSVPHIVFNVFMLPVMFVPNPPSRAQLDLNIRQIIQGQLATAPLQSPSNSSLLSNQSVSSSNTSDILPPGIIEPDEDLFKKPVSNPDKEVENQVVKSPPVPVKITKKIHNPYGCYVVRINGRPIPIKSPTTRKIVTYIER